MAFLGVQSVMPRLRLLLLLGLSGGALAVGSGIDEYQVKAAFLFNFAKFVEWPAQAFKSTEQPFAICVFGRNPFSSTLEDVVQGKLVGHRKFVVLEIAEAQQIGGCQILFVGASEQKRVRAVLGEIKVCCVLTVGESDEFISSGGMINLRLKDARVRMEIDPDAAERAKLRISSKLLSLADIARR